MVNIYELLKIPHTASETEIKAAIANAFVEGSAPEAALIKAREWLLNPETRAKYDAKLLAENPHLRQPETPPAPRTVSMMQPKRAATKEEREAILAAKQAKAAPKPEPELVPLEDDDEVFYRQPWYQQKPVLIAAGIVLAGILGTAAWYYSKPEIQAKEDLEHIRELSIDPDSVKFKNLVIYKAAKPIQGTIICGEINSKNRMGGYRGFEKFYFVKVIDLNGKTDSVDYAFQTLGTNDDEDSEKRIRKYNNYEKLCENKDNPKDINNMSL